MRTFVLQINSETMKQRRANIEKKDARRRAMRAGLRAAAFAVCGAALASCSQMHYVNIETYNPAGITFPTGVRRVLIVNNAVAQPNVPLESTVRKLPDSLKLAGDSVVADFCRMLGREIAASPRFDDVLLYEGCYRTDSSVYRERQLAPGEVERLCGEHGVDAVISLDRLSFRIREDVRAVTWLDAVGEVEVEVSGVLRASLPDRDTPLATVYITDTVMPQTAPEEVYPTDAYLLPEPADVLQMAAEDAVTKVYVNFVPYWSGDMRWYYVSTDSRWKEAAAFAAAERWENAAEIWEALYGGTRSWKAKARLAANLALCAEYSGQLAQALEWAAVAHRHFSGHLSAGDRAVVMQNLYVNILERRMEAEKTLRRQLPSH
jgi:hypothetical protein